LKIIRTGQRNAIRRNAMFYLLTLTAAMGAAPAAEADASSPERVRQSVERSLVFLEKSGTDWWKDSKCASCHHVPISIWSLTEARQHGFAINEKALHELQSVALTSYANHPNLKPVGQDGKPEGMSLNTVYLTLAATASSAADEKTAESLNKFAAHLLAKQEADGSWKAHGKLPPVEDTTEVRTMQSLLALSMMQDRGLLDDTWTPSRDRALAWLRKTKLSDEHQSLVFQVLTAKRFGKPDEVEVLVKRLLEQQKEDGGWAQDNERSSDALATGQSLYALAAAGVDPRQTSVQNALAFLTQTQTKDGSWNVPYRSQKNSGRAISHYGTGWAAIGLIRTLAAVSVTTADTEAEVIPAPSITDK
jgi:Squalene-hopene cyclase C-terminal domain